jgi:hypothetical protein
MTEIFSAAQIEELSAEIDRQLQELRRSGATTYKSGDELEPDGALSKQKEAIEQLTQEPMPNFLAGFGRAAKSFICDKDGLLHKQWEEFEDLSIKDALEVVGKVLIQHMGFTKDTVSKLAVATIVVLLDKGLKDFCDKYGKNV